MDKARAARVMEELSQLYPEARPELNFSNPYETLIATILSAQCTDKRVNMVTARLFPLYPDARAMAKLEPEQLEPLIKECGLYHNKAKNIVAAGLADKCEIQLSYAIGVARPTSIMVDTFGTGKLSNQKLVDIIRENFDLRSATRRFRWIPTCSACRGASGSPTPTRRRRSRSSCANCWTRRFGFTATIC